MADSPEDRVAIGKWASNYSTRFALGNSTSRTASGMSSSGFYIEDGKRLYDPSISGLGRAKTHYRVDDEQMLRQGYTMQEIADEEGGEWEPLRSSGIDGGRVDRIVRAKEESKRRLVRPLEIGASDERLRVGFDLSRIEKRSALEQLAKAGGVGFVRSLWIDSETRVEIRQASKKRPGTMTLRNGDDYATLTVGDWERVLIAPEGEISLPSTRGDVNCVLADWLIAIKALDVPDEDDRPRRMTTMDVGIYRGDEKIV